MCFVCCHYRCGIQSDHDDVSDSERAERSVDAHGGVAVACVRADELVLRMHLHRAIRDDEEHVQGVSMGGGKHPPRLQIGATTDCDVDLHPQEAQSSRTSILWNVWVMLAAPAVWLAWSMVTFLVSILSFVWRTGATDDPADSDAGARTLGPLEALGPRLAITVVLVLGLVYFVLIVKTFQNYGGSVGRSRGRRWARGSVERGTRREERGGEVVRRCAYVCVNGGRYVGGRKWIGRSSIGRADRRETRTRHPTRAR